MIISTNVSAGESVGGIPEQLLRSSNFDKSDPVFICKQLPISTGRLF